MRIPRIFTQRSTLAGLSLLAAFSVSCGSNNNNSSSNTGSSKPASSVATQAAAAATQPASPSQAAAVSSAAPTQAAAVASPGAITTVAQTFKAPGGSADWSSGAAGCHGVKAPAGAEAPKASDVGITPTEIKLGTTQPLSGPASTYSPIIKTIQACFNAVNADGGIYGRKINLIVEDDQYLPANTVPLVKKLVEQDKVFIAASLLGTPVNSSVFEYLNDNKIPQMWILSGASKWSTTPKEHPWSIGWQPVYPDEGATYARYIQQNLKGKKIGILYQNDDFGKDYVIGMKKVLGEKGTTDNPIVDEEVYETTASDVAGQITNLKNKGADLFVLIAIPKFAGLALKAVADQGWKPAIIMTSVAVDTTTVDLAGGKQNVEGIISDTYYHQATETTEPAVQEVKDFMAKADSSQQFVNYTIYGYMIAQTYIETFKRAGVNLTRDSIMQASLSFDKWVIPQLFSGITFNSANRRPVGCFKLLKYVDGQIQLFGDTVCGGG